MKILLNDKQSTLEKSQLQLIKLLEHSSDFETAVWVARANLGVRPENLLRNKQIPESIKPIFQKTWKNRENYPTVSEINSILSEVDELSFDEMDKFFTTDKGLTLSSRWATANYKFEERLYLHTLLLLEGFRLPKNWAYPLQSLIRIGYMSAKDFMLNAISIHVDQKWLRKRGVEKLNLNKLTPYFIYDPQGVQIVFSGKIKKVSEVTNWIKENWKEIQKVMELANLPEYWGPNLRVLDQTIEIIKLQQKFPEKLLGEIIGEYGEAHNLSDDDYDKVTDQNVSKELQQFWDYVQKLTLHKRKKSK